ncbi:MAG: TetR/AcrR family transcriptional regulator [Desulfobacteraceae bacterium]|nr:TetR/AcrR family transcriptional regulator [Desulfobacteraceae bacterium]
MAKKDGKIKSELSRSWICEALLQLMDDKPYNRISITEITRKAGVSRVTFYRHYKSKDDVLSKRLNDLFGEFYTLTKPHSDSNNFKYYTGHLGLSFMKKNTNIFMKMVEAGIALRIYDVFLEYINKIYIINDEDDHYYAHYIAGGLFATIFEWINRGHDRSPEAMASFLEKMHNSNDLLEQKVKHL